MKHPIMAVITMGLLAGPTAALAEEIESGTTVLLTFRTCIAGLTSVCDNLSAPLNTYAGFPGDQTAQANADDDAFGATSGSAELAGGTVGIVSATARSLAGTRNGSNSATLQRYTNTGSVTERMTLNAVLSYDLAVPPGNAGLPVAGRSSASAVVFIYKTSDEFIEAGTNQESNFQAVWWGNFCTGCPNAPPADFVWLGYADFGDFSNATGAGTMTRTLSADVDPGESIWIGAQLQSLAANGAVVDATLNTHLSSNVYACAGFEPPADEDLVVRKQNRVLPLRMALLDLAGMGVSDITPPVVGVSYTANGGAPVEITNELDYAGQGDDGNQFLFNGSDWAFNLKTKGLAAGTYTLTTVSGDPAYSINPACEATVIVQ